MDLEEPAVLSEYEQIQANTISRNNAKLRSLGFKVQDDTSSSSTLHSGMSFGDERRTNVATPPHPLLPKSYFNCCSMDFKMEFIFGCSMVCLV